MWLQKWHFAEAMRVQAKCFSDLVYFLRSFEFRRSNKTGFLKIIIYPDCERFFVRAQVNSNAYAVMSFKCIRQSNAFLSGKCIQTFVLLGFLKDHFDNTIIVVGGFNGLKRGFVNGVLKKFTKYRRYPNFEKAYKSTQK